MKQNEDPSKSARISISTASSKLQAAAVTCTNSHAYAHPSIHPCTNTLERTGVMKEGVMKETNQTQNWSWPHLLQRWGQTEHVKALVAAIAQDDAVLPVAPRAELAHEHIDVSGDTRAKRHRHHGSAVGA